VNWRVAFIPVASGRFQSTCVGSFVDRFMSYDAEFPDEPEVAVRLDAGARFIRSRVSFLH
jgi:hypothetical protein